MLRRAALLLSVLVPALVVAQVTGPTAGTLVPTPSALGLASCSATGTQTVSLTWTTRVVATAGSATTTFTPAGIYRVFVSNSAPPTTGNIGQCPDSNSTTGVVTTKIGNDIVANSQTATTPTALSGFEMVKGAGYISPVTQACTADADGKTVYVCVHWFPVDPNTGNQISTTPQGFASGSITLQLAAPDAPTITSIGVGDSRLTVNFSAAASGAQATSFIATATAVNNAAEKHDSPSTATSPAIISGLTNDVPYSVTVTAFSSGGNPSPASAPVVGTPRQVDDFFTWYKKQGGQEQGGCSTGGGGALLAVAGLLAALRRRK